MLNIKSLLTKILNFGVFKSGATMTGQLILPGSFVTSGWYVSSQTTLKNFLAEVKLSSGVIGRVVFSASYTPDSSSSEMGVTLPSGTYMFIFLPHRSGGINGTATGDNCNYNNLLLINSTNHRMYAVHSSNKSGNGLTEIREIKTFGISSSGSHPTAVTNSYYSLNTNSSWVYATEGPNIYNIHLYLSCTTVQSSYQKIGQYSSTHKTSVPVYFSLTNSAGTVVLGKLDIDGYIYVYGGYAGHQFAGAVTYISDN